MKARKLILASLGLAFLLISVAVPPAAEATEIKSFTTTATNEDGSIDLKAGSHPYEYTVKLEFEPNSQGEFETGLSTLVVDLPPGMVGDPFAVPRCKGSAFEGLQSQCPGNTQIGIAHIEGVGGVNPASPVYNLTPGFGVPFSAGFQVAGLGSIQEASLRTGEDLASSGSYGIRISDITIPPTLQIRSITETIWGVPAFGSKEGEGHFDERQCFNSESQAFFGCSTDIPQVPFLTLPTSCNGPLSTKVTLRSLKEPGIDHTESIESLDDGGLPEGLSSCERLPFNPTITVEPETTASDSPTGLHVNLHIPQNQDPKQLATAHLKDTVVTLPQGMALNPSSADGLGACSSAQIDLHGPGPANCPDNSKVGTVSVETPLLDHPLKGAVYLAKQGDNPFNSLLAIYIAVDDPSTGVVVKLAGKVEPDPVTGQLKTTFKDNPQLPFEDFDLDFFGGPRASLTTPPICGKYTTTTDLTPWTSPEGADVFPSDSFNVSGACAQSEAQMPNKPALEAGTATPLAASYSPLLFKVSRENGSQRIGAINATLAPGLTGRLAGLSQCSGAQIAAAATRNQPGQGAIEQQSPSCPGSSEIGTVSVGVGSGAPFYATGKAYLAGPYKGAPISFAFITPAIAGPFDLGTVVVRAPAYIDPATAQITVKSDPIPQILDGIPLDIRSVAVSADRDRFTLNPTSCDPMAIGASAISTLGQSAALSNRFQVGGCKGLDFEPKFALKLKGGTKRGDNPKLIATVKAKEGEANIQSAAVKLPPSAFLDQSHIRTVCTRVQFAADQCPKGSIYGTATARTPLLDQPLSGNVYLRSSNHKLPDLIVDLNGPASLPIRVDLAGRTDSVKGSLRNTFEAVPDAPVSSFRLELLAGRRGLVVNSRNLCAHDYHATVKLQAHSGKEYEARPAVQNDCGQGRKGSHKRLRPKH